ncbi:hypothetical protein BX666DRAFT_1875835 [Dichotomocladium elegans]|nr:hypothetical protein BX666DRAFT_1875835 [Dichotomocladium elegans]
MSSKDLEWVPSESKLVAQFLFLRMGFLRIKSRKSKNTSDSIASPQPTADAASRRYDNADDGAHPTSPIADSFMSHGQPNLSSTIEGCTSSHFDDIIAEMNAFEIRDSDFNWEHADVSRTNTAVLLTSDCETTRVPTRASDVKAARSRQDSLCPAAISSGQLTISPSSTFKARYIVPDSDASDSDESSSKVIPVPHCEKVPEKKAKATTEFLMTRMKERHRQECRKSWNIFEKSHNHTPAPSAPRIYSMSSMALGRLESSPITPLTRSVSAATGFYGNSATSGNPSQFRMSAPPHSNMHALKMQGPVLPATRKGTTSITRYPSLNTSKAGLPSPTRLESFSEFRNAPRQSHQSLPDLPIIGCEIPTKALPPRQGVSPHHEQSPLFSRQELNGAQEPQTQEQYPTQKQRVLTKGHDHQRTPLYNHKTQFEKPLTKAAMNYSKEDEQEEEDDDDDDYEEEEEEEKEKATTTAVAAQNPSFIARQVVPLGDSPPEVLVSQSETGTKYYYLLLPQRNEESPFYLPDKECLHDNCHRACSTEAAHNYCCHRFSQERRCQASSSKGCSHGVHKCSRAKGSMGAPLATGLV